jgi:hypothetical protein
MDDPDTTYMGSVPPVQVTASHCGSVSINVKFIIEPREPESLRRYADDIEKQLDGTATLGLSV